MRWRHGCGGVRTNSRLLRLSQSVDFGESVSLNSDGTRLAVGAPFSTDEVALHGNAGLGTVYEWQGQDWVQVCDPIYGDDHAAFAHEVSMSGDGSAFILGSFALDPSGQARVFRDAQWVSSVSEPTVPHTSVSCFPNPSSGALTVSGFAGQARLELRSALGQVVSVWDGCMSPLNLDLSSFAHGLYTLHGASDATHFTQKVVLEP